MSQIWANVPHKRERHYQKSGIDLGTCLDKLNVNDLGTCLDKLNVSDLGTCLDKLNVSDLIR